MKLIKTVDAIGHVLCHDITQIVPGVYKGPAFKKGHIVKEEDIPLLLNLGKEQLYIWEFQEGALHENDAAEILRAICQGGNISRSETNEGKIELSAEIEGLFKADSRRINAINSLGQIVIATRHGNFPVKAGDMLAGVRVVPLVIEEEKLSSAKALAGVDPLLKILPFKRKKTGVITTGSEVFKGRIQDAFTPAVKAKLAEFGIDVSMHVLLGDEHENITKACLDMIERGMEFIICTGGMSVDPDDKTPLAIKNTRAKVVSYGAPVLPGAMFMLAYYSASGKTIPITGLPGCVMYEKRTIFDLILPRILADDMMTEEDFLSLGHGGLCLHCKDCTFPNCGFGKGA